MALYYFQMRHYIIKLGNKTNLFTLVSFLINYIIHFILKYHKILHSWQDGTVSTNSD